MTENTKLLKSIDNKLSQLIDLLSEQKTTVTRAVPVRNISLEDITANPAIAQTLAKVYENYQDIAVHENAQFAMNDDGMVCVTDIKGNTHQLNVVDESIRPDSSYIQRVSYIQNKDVLEVKFNTGHIGHYTRKCNKNEWNNLVETFMYSTEISKDFHSLIRNNNNNVNYTRVA